MLDRPSDHTQDDAVAALGRADRLLAAGRFAEAEAAYRRALAHPAPGSPHLGPAYLGLAAALLNQGQNALAIAAARNAVRVMPQDGAAQLALGTALRIAGEPEAALACYDAVLAGNPDEAEAEFQRGNALASLGRAAEAVIAFCAAIRLRPGHAQTHYNLATLLQRDGMLEQAASCYAAASAARPDFAEARVNRGNCLLALGRMKEAEEAYRDALHVWPGYAVAHANLGCALHALGRFEEAAAHCDTAIRLQPDYPEAYSNLGSALLVQGRFEEAIAAFQGALALRPNYAEAHANLGAALLDSGDIEGALLACEAAIELAPDQPDARFNHGLALLAAGRYAEGWAEHEHRLRLAHYPRRTLGCRQWGGERLSGERVLLHAEQGLGDTLQFVRYAAEVAARGGRVILEAQRPLLRLLGRVEGAAEIVASGDSLPEFDLHAPLMSLPHACGTTLETIPGQAPYLHADPALTERWASRLPADGKLRVGLVWAGSPRPGEPRNHHADRRRSLRLACLAPLAGIPGVRFVSLQLGPPSEQARTPPPGLDLIDPTPDIADFEDTAALIAGLDLVISVDTSVAHLAGGLGRPVWVLSRFDGCWRWLSGRDDSPWYPTLRLYRQERAGDWSGPIARIVQDLRGLAAWPPR